MTNSPALVLRENTSNIMALWQTEVTKEVPAAKEANAIALYDHLPNIIEDIADIFERQIEKDNIKEDTRYLEILKNSEEHGRHRSTTSHYTVDQVVHEYIIFHRTLSEFLQSHNCFDTKVSDLLKYVIETSILKSVGSFSRSIQEVQEKLIGTIAHDIRNPLSIANLSLDMFEDEEDEEWKAKMLVSAKRSLKKAIGLIEGLMDGITVKAGEGMLMNFEKIDIINDLNWVFEEAKEVYSNEIVLYCKPEKIEGIFDSTAIRRLLENLISNAVKYGYPNRTVTITVIDTPEVVELSIHNEGEVLTKEKQESIFTFLEGNKNKSSTVKSWGMGLTLAQIVASAHGGDIKLTSTEDHGTSFNISINKNFNSQGSKRTKLTFK